jgi:hypothetical protein
VLAVSQSTRLSRYSTDAPKVRVAYASWASPGTFSNAQVLDVMPISHKILEAFNDPFVNNITPRWQFPVGTSWEIWKPAIQSRCWRILLSRLR